ncbi:outer membrane receptor protein involved in Fe transport [Spirosoma lacussanchae]|uniref:carboxypeptidase-like regulatory domain-containing protein n=1 Tax=Spirosoma lacussanchae TaxID=1884249 RepID=UPI0011086AEF|nr:carboxypeptidase-like regulatory domain-containing protein [Spirosoma lacussanchae]
MSKFIAHSLLVLWVICSASIAALAQGTITGKITDDAQKEPLAGISIAVKGKVIGTITDTKGNFSLTTNTERPFVIQVTGVGFQSQEFTISENRTNLNITLKEQVLVGQEVVVSASRVEESVLKSPVSVEKMDLRAIQSTPSANFYDGLSNVKGVDIATQGLLFKSINMRGFGATGNPRTVQMIDGMDNSAPGLNFPVDNIAGIPEQDIESVEILPGAASALYGPNAIQGLILLNSKSPFLYQGLSANVKTGIMSASNRTTQNTGFYDASIRYAKAFNNKLAFKVNLAYLKAQDWQANNYTNLNPLNGVEGNADPNRGPGTAINYDGTNTYGDEAQANLRSVGQSLVTARLLPAAALGLLPDRNVSRTGYPEVNLVDYNTKSLKVNGAVHYRLTDKVELIGQVNYGFGTTVYTGTGRYSLRDFSLAQGKLELRGDNFTLRAYTTQERSGKSYTAGLASIFLNEAWKPSTTWFGQYVGAYVQARSAGQADDAAHLTARGVADQGRPLPGTDAYNTLYERVRNTPINQGGGAFQDKSNLYHVEGLYNFKNQIKFADVLIGGNLRQYSLGSEGTLFADNVEGRTGRIGITEFGGFAQVSKSLFSEHLKLTGSLRYDKNQNFAGQFTPRVSAVATFGEHNFRLSYQTGFRIPTTQNQYIDLLVPNARLIGGLPEFYTRYGLQNAYSRSDLGTLSSDITTLATNRDFQNQVINALTAQILPLVTAAVSASVAAGQIPASAAPAIIQQAVTAQVTANAQNAIQGQAINTVVGNLKPYQRKEFKPERVANYEIGYRGVFNKRLFVDAYYYYSVYTNFIGSVILVQPTAAFANGLIPASGILGGGTRQAYSLPANSSEKITASGWAIGLNYSLPKGYGLTGNIANNTLNNFTPSPELQTAAFNTPKYRWNVGFNKRPVGGSNIGFAVAFKHQDSFTWEGFAQPSETGIPLYTNTIVPAISNLDAQVNYKVQRIKSIVKLGATNLFGKPYFQAYGNPYVGSTYYLSLTFDELLN